MRLLPPAPLLLALAVALGGGLASGCHPGAFGPAGGTRSARAGGPANALVVHPHYRMAFEALKAALDDDELLVARGTLRRLFARLQADQAMLPTMAQAKQAAAEGTQDALVLQVLAGEMPSREGAQAGLTMARNFERVIDGRARFGALDLDIELERLSGTETCRISLLATSRWPEPLVLRPGPATLDVLRSSLDPRSGTERRDSSKTYLDAEIAMEIPAQGSTSMPLIDIPIQVPVGAIATRLRAELSFNGGTLEESDESYPARSFGVDASERTDIASWVPATLVEPSELVRAWKSGEASLPSLLERTVRIAPARYPEALDRIGEAAELMPVETFPILVPSLRWIARAGGFERDAGAWRRWVLARLDDRRAAEDERR